MGFGLGWVAVEQALLFKVCAAEQTLVLRVDKGKGLSTLKGLKCLESCFKKHFPHRSLPCSFSSVPHHSGPNPERE